MIIDSDQIVMNGRAARIVRRAERAQRKALKQIRKNNAQQDKAYTEQTLAEQGSAPPPPKGAMILGSLFESAGSALSNIFGGPSKAIAAGEDASMSGTWTKPAVVIPALAIATAVGVTVMYRHNQQ